MAALEHPHIVPLDDYWREPDAAYLVTRQMRGGRLATVLERGPLTPAQTLTIVDQLGNAMQTAHRPGVVHGDINSGNVLLDADGNAYLSDFGIAFGDDEVAPSADIHGLGVLVAEAPEVGAVASERSRRCCRDLLRVSTTARSSGDRNAGDGYRSVGELVADLHAALGDEAAASNGLRLATSPRPSPTRTKACMRSTTTDAVDFFGRERLVEHLIARLGSRAARADRRGRRSQWKWQVERGEGRAASRRPGRRHSALGLMVHDRDDAPPIRSNSSRRRCSVSLSTRRRHCWSSSPGIRVCCGRSIGCCLTTGRSWCC